MSRIAKRWSAGDAISGLGVAVACFLMLPVPLLSQDRIQGQGNWEVVYDKVNHDGTYAGRLRLREADGAACQTSRNGQVQAAQQNLTRGSGFDQQYEPGDPEWRAMEALANMSLCRNIVTGEVLSGPAPLSEGGGAGSGSLGAGGAPIPGGAEADQLRDLMDSVLGNNPEERDDRVMGAAIGQLLGADTPEELGAAADLSAAIGGLFGGNDQRSGRSGFGTESYDDGGVYEGEFRNGKRHGQGTYRSRDGGVYEGQWKDGEINGRGEFRWSDGSVYDGEWRNAKQHGQGTFRWPSGDVYTGEFKNNLRHGRGTGSYPNGEIETYEGEWRDNVRHGQATLRLNDGTVYEGRFRGDKLHGQGVMRLTNGQTCKVEHDSGREISRSCSSDSRGAVDQRAAPSEFDGVIPPATRSSFFPYKVGDVHMFEVTGSGKYTLMRREVRGTVTVGTRTYLQLDETYSGPEPVEPFSLSRFFRWDEASGEVRQADVLSLSSSDPMPSEITSLRTGAQVGETWSVRWGTCTVEEIRLDTGWRIMTGCKSSTGDPANDRRYTWASNVGLMRTTDAVDYVESLGRPTRDAESVTANQCPGATTGTDWSAGSFEEYYRQERGCNNGIWWGRWEEQSGALSYYFHPDVDDVLALTAGLEEVEPLQYLPPADAAFVVWRTFRGNIGTWRGSHWLRGFLVLGPTDTSAVISPRLCDESPIAFVEAIDGNTLVIACEEASIHLGDGQNNYQHIFRGDDGMRLRELMVNAEQGAITAVFDGTDWPYYVSMDRGMTWSSMRDSASLPQGLKSASPGTAAGSDPDISVECRTPGHIGDFEGTFEEFYRGRLGCTKGVWVAPAIVDGLPTYAYAVTAEELSKKATESGWTLGASPRFVEP